MPTGSEIRAAKPGGKARPLPIIFYGISITQGACPSRPGMTHAAILGLCSNRDVINLEFSGNGRMEAELGILLAELPAAAYVLDCLPNLNPKQVEDRSYSYAFLEESARVRNASSREALRAAHAALLDEGVRGLFYLPGADLVGSDGEGLVDGSHPSDLGFMRQADAFEPLLQRMLGN